MNVRIASHADVVLPKLAARKPIEQDVRMKTQSPVVRLGRNIAALAVSGGRIVAAMFRRARCLTRPGRPAAFRRQRAGNVGRHGAAPGTHARHCPSPARAAGVLVFMLFTGAAPADERFVQKVTIRSGLVVVVSEGDFEARSIGSYSVRVYADPGAEAGNETTFYTAGLVRSRDGAVLSAAPLAVPGRKNPLLMVVVQSAGSGGYLSADALAVENRSVRIAASVSGLTPKEDPARLLLRKLAGTAP